MNLRGAAATIFALTAVVPLLLFVLFVWRFDLAMQTEAQVGVALALLIGLLGFVVFRRMVDRVAGLAQALRSANAAEGGRDQPPVDVALVPGLGRLSEIGDIADTLSRLLADLRASTERLEDLVFKLGTLNEMVELAARIPKIQDLLGHVLERTMRTVRASIGSIMLLDPERQMLSVVVSRGHAHGPLVGDEVKVGEGVAGKVVEIGEPVLVDDIETDPRFAKTNDPKYNSASFICLPLRVGDRIIGVVNLAKKEPAPVAGAKPPSFSQTDLQFLNALMTHTAYAVDNARLLEEARQSAQRLQEVVEDQKLRLTVAQRQMVQAAKLSALGQLVAGVAHELNNPLTVLLGGIELLAEDTPEHWRSRLTMLQDAVERAQHIVQGLLTFARRVRLERQPVELAELVEKVLTVTAADLRLAHVRIEQDAEPELPRIWADANQLQQVLVNIVTNAKQAMAEVEGERRLRIVLRRAGPSHARIRVEDTGPGIPAELLATIFDPFVTTKGAGGTGLGLSISYGIVREHGGEITVESALGAGTAFTIELPIGAPSVQEPAASPRPALRLEGRHVVVVEDDEGLQSLVQSHLERAGCTTSRFPNAEAALAGFPGRVDLVLFDFYLPGMSGLEFAREVVGRHPGLDGRLLLMTPGLLPEGAQPLVAKGAWKLLAKPFSRRQLLDAVRDTLG